jgi:rubredoxin
MTTAAPFRDVAWPDGARGAILTPEGEAAMSGDDLQRYMCMGCGFLYDEALGLPEHGIRAGTRWDDIPDDWVCPDCGTPKSGFEMVAIPYASEAPSSGASIQQCQGG